MLANTPQYDLCINETQNEKTFFQLAEELDPMPDVGDHYLGADILLPRGDEIAKGNLVANSHYASENVLDRVYTI